MTEPKKPRGFAAMTPERRREISSMAGKRSTSRPFRDVPGAAKMASEKGVKARLTKASDHDHSV